MEELRQSEYRKLIERVKPPPTKRKSAEGELDRLVAIVNEKRRARLKATATPADKPDPLQRLRELTVQELVPVFVELVEKYSESGLIMHMDASKLLEGGREILFEFGLGEYRLELQGTVTSDSIAFHEVRHAPIIEGQLVAGPMLRLKTLNADVFREFICGRLAVLLRMAERR